jgi:hypothetical protein
LRRRCDGSMQRGWHLYGKEVISQFTQEMALITSRGGTLSKK